MLKIKFPLGTSIMLFLASASYLSGWSYMHVIVHYVKLDTETLGHNSWPQKTCFFLLWFIQKIITCIINRELYLVLFQYSLQYLQYFTSNFCSEVHAADSVPHCGSLSLPRLIDDIIEQPLLSVDVCLKWPQLGNNHASASYFEYLITGTGINALSGR